MTFNCKFFRVGGSKLLGLHVLMYFEIIITFIVCSAEKGGLARETRA